MKILIVDDDPRLRETVRQAVERAGFQAITAANGQEALTHSLREAPDLMVLDIGLPEMDGFEVCRQVRARSDLPILFLTARDDEIDRILGLEMGADDYVTKPFSPRELVARVKVILKRSRGVERVQALTHGNLALDLGARRCTLGDAEVPLTGTEFQMLCALLQAPGRLVTRVSLVNQIWGARSDVSDRTVDSHLRNLRQKLIKAGADGAIETVHGQGVRMGPAG